MALKVLVETDRIFWEIIEFSKMRLNTGAEMQSGSDIISSKFYSADDILNKNTLAVDTNGSLEYSRVLPTEVLNNIFQFMHVVECIKVKLVSKLFIGFTTPALKEAIYWKGKFDAMKGRAQTFEDAFVQAQEENEYRNCDRILLGVAILLSLVAIVGMSYMLWNTEKSSSEAKIVTSDL